MLIVWSTQSDNRGILHACTLVLSDDAIRTTCYTYPPGFPSFCKLSLVTTCPQASIIGGFASVDCSLDTGQAKIEWYLFSGGSGISI